jgi:hypothetical protein
LDLGVEVLAMDPVSLIVAALAAGAAAGVKSTIQVAISDAYGAVKKLLSERYKRVNLSGLEDNPGSKIQQAAIEETLRAVDAGKDEELSAAARALLAVIKEAAPDAAIAVGIDLQRLDIAGEINIQEVSARGGRASGVVARDIRAKSLNVGRVDVDARGQSKDPR